MSIAEQNGAPAAWYPDRTHPSQLRWWDGNDWTADVRPLAGPPAVEVPLPDPRHGLHAVAKPAQGFGHASAEQLRAWPPPQPQQRNEVPASVNQVPREWAANSSVDAIRDWMSKPVEPIQFVPNLSATTPAPASYTDWQPQQAPGFADPVQRPAFPDPVQRPALPDPVQPTAFSAPVQPPSGVPLTRRQLRDLVGGPLTIGVEDQ